MALRASRDSTSAQTPFSAQVATLSENPVGLEWGRKWTALKVEGRSQIALPLRTGKMIGRGDMEFHKVGVSSGLQRLRIWDLLVWHPQLLCGSLGHSLIPFRRASLADE